MWVDKGKEFYNKDVQNLVEIYSTENEEKSSVVERWNRTMKEKMWRYFSANSTNKYIDILNDLVDQYNDTKHSSIKMNPVEASMPLARLAEPESCVCDSKAPMLRIALPTSSKPKFAVGDRVRITKKKKTFEKGYTPRWTEEVFTVSEIQYTNPVTYKIKDYNKEEIQGTFYEQELQKTDKEIFRIERVIQKRGAKEYANNRAEKVKRYVDTKLKDVSKDYEAADLAVTHAANKYTDALEELKIESPSWSARSASIIIKNAVIKLSGEDEAGAVQKGKYGTDSVPFTLVEKHPNKMKEKEKRVNEYLVNEEGLDKATLPIGYRMRQCEHITVPQITNFTWRLGVKSSPEKPRWVIIGFQTEKDNNQLKNPDIFDNVNVRNMMVTLNSTRYPCDRHPDLRIQAKKFQNIRGIFVPKRLHHIYTSEKIKIIQKEIESLTRGSESIQKEIKSLTTGLKTIETKDETIEAKFQTIEAKFDSVARDLETIQEEIDDIMKIKYDSDEYDSEFTP
ncbi:uncharacterized protein LOC128244118 [Mya arenaria]|uniref:uncharacterized protein LOC128244118 n=1 Tax=Mya arenaria TaxID=6604 RepID=UPI0022E63928|nr:uncharacterized protein LOC128244118 [Mya arenaria]